MSDTGRIYRFAEHLAVFEALQDLPVADESEEKP